MTLPTPLKVHRGSGPEDNAPHILVVDDDNRIRDLLARYLQEHGFRVTTAIDAATARSTMRSLTFDLLILDVMMPHESGLNARCRARVMLILMLTGGAVEQRIEAWRLVSRRPAAGTARVVSRVERAPPRRHGTLPAKCDGAFRLPYRAVIEARRRDRSPDRTRAGSAALFRSAHRGAGLAAGTRQGRR
jgi:CheY-like chemotaxis protein